MNRRAWTRRSVLALGAGALGVTQLPALAESISVTVGGLTFTVPATISSSTGSSSTGSSSTGTPSTGTPALGDGWQWAGRSGSTGARPSTIVLARADLASTDAAEVLGLVLAGAVSGALPHLKVSSANPRSMSGGGEQTRVLLEYDAAPQLRFHGALLIATRALPPAGVLVVVGDGQLTARTTDDILGSARWLK